ncbi:MarR family winged helix-turn-helix transcriptional regulator [uncultured Streptomyces sp.]|uniref:MarR family winged helix-turn-helix transcriptional regulator n=1 Tax=uncultured Streptomyces sp. TaxID=174707 RepID=UPI0026266DC4|nr:MarR family transcriptional regulator [uncultured Streptomyces sp.]
MAHEDKPTHLVEYEAMLLGRHSHLFNARKRNATRLLDQSAYLLLSRLQMDGPMSIGELSAAFGLDASTLNRQTAAMLRAGVVERIPDPEGGIARKFSMTPEGERRLAADRASSIRSLETVMADWTAEEVADFAAHLTRFNHDIERLQGQTWTRPAPPARS